MSTPFVVRVAGAVLRGFVTATKESTRLRQVWTSLRWGEETEAYEHVEPYGYTARPFAGAEAIAVRVGAAADHTVILLTPDGRYRIKTLAEGEVALYDDRGSVVRLGRDGIHVSATGVCTVASSGICTVEGSTIKLGATAAQAVAKWPLLKLWLNGHTHTGVTAGAGVSGTVVTPVTDAPATTKTVAE